MKNGVAKAQASSAWAGFVEIKESITAFRSPEGRSCGQIEVNDHREVLPLDSREFQEALRKLYHDKHGTLPKTQLFRTVMDMLEFRATQRRRNVYVRMARRGKAIYIDIGDAKWRQIKVTPDGWKIIHRSKILFRRPAGMKPLPIPKKVVSGGAKKLDKFGNLINTRKTDKILTRGWTQGAFNPDGPFFILVVLGEPGSGKSTLVNMLKDLIDPGAAPLRGLPKNTHDLVVAAQNSWVLAFDNVSFIPAWLSDDLCRLATGSGMSTRKLYTDSEEAIFQAKRPIIINGISNMIMKSDLADRALFVTMKPLDEGKRRTEKELLEGFNKMKPHLLGAILNGLSHFLKHEDDVKGLRLPTRMPDFVNSVISAGTTIFHSEDDFPKAFIRSQNEKSETILENDLVGAEIMKLMDKLDVRWSGTASMLLEQLEGIMEPSNKQKIIRDKLWPKSASALSVRLTELSPHFRKIGYQIRFSRKAQQREISVDTVKDKKAGKGFED